MNNTVSTLRRLMDALRAWQPGQPAPREALADMLDELDRLKDNPAAYAELRAIVAESRQKGHRLIEDVPVILLACLLLEDNDHD